MNDTVTVRVAQGNLRGRKTKTKSGKEFFSFAGIPYARPPVGPLRFKPPQSPEPWSGTRDALDYPPICPQEDVIFRQLRGQEDCLYLNVNTAQVPSGETKPSIPVMVWIHGGGFTMGSGNPDMYGSDYFVDADVVFVSINYRLGALGFLSLGNEVAPGNMGLKDQVAALQWVKENIAVFGGDPNKITIFGESAGGASVHYLMLSPLTKGLFHKAIAQSGSALNPWAFSLTNTERAFKLGEKLGCKTSDPDELLHFLMKADVLELVKASSKLYPRDENITGLKFPFSPTVEPKMPGAFLSEHPLRALQAGRFHKVPFMTGFTSDEGIITLKELKDELWPELNSKFDALLPEKLTRVGNTVPMSTVSDAIRRNYFGNKPLSKDNISQYVDFQSDTNFVEGIYTTVKYTTALSIAPAYFYKFKFDGALGIIKSYVGTDMKGVCHGDDLGYMFTSMLVDLELEPSSPEMKTIKRWISLLTNFAKLGNPTPVLSENIPVFWQPCTSKNIRYLTIDNEITMNEFTEMKRLKVWDEIYKCKL